MQTGGFVSAIQMLFVALVVLLIGFVILRWMAVKQYRLKRKGEAEDSMLVSLGDMISNTRMSIFDIIFLGIFIIAQSITYSYLILLVGYENLLPALLIFAILLILVYVVFLFYTIRGKVYRRTEQILNDHQRIGHEDLIIRKHLAELLRESEGDNFTQVEVAKSTLENLMDKENKTGDAVRQIMENPEQLRDIERMKTLPSIWKSFRFSLLILTVFTVVLLYFVYHFLCGALSQLDMLTNVFPFVLLFTFVLIITLYLEVNNAQKVRRKVLFGL
ncbi:MAG: hypothetical protein ACTSVR_02350 [Candidatus Thorarchaeota archaeon]